MSHALLQWLSWLAPPAGLSWAAWLLVRLDQARSHMVIRTSSWQAEYHRKGGEQNWSLEYDDGRPG
jgi:hypothetical protein